MVWIWTGNAFEAVCAGFANPCAMPGPDKVAFSGQKSALNNGVMRKSYSSDISQEQFEHIHDLLQSMRKRTRSSDRGSL